MHFFVDFKSCELCKSCESCDERSDEKKKSIEGLTIFADLKKKVSPADDEIGTYLQLEEIELDANSFTWWCE